MKLAHFCEELLDRGDLEVVVVLFVEELLDREDLKEEFFEKLLKRGDLETAVLFCDMLLKRLDLFESSFDILFFSSM